MVDADAINVKRMNERERVRVAKVEAGESLGNDDRVLPVGREVHVVRILNGDVRTRMPGHGIDRRQRVAAVVRDVEGLQVPRGNDVLRQPPDREVVDDPGGRRVDDINRVAERVRHVHPRRIVLDHSGQGVRTIGPVDVDLTVLHRGRRGRGKRCRTGDRRGGRRRSRHDGGLGFIGCGTGGES